MGFVSDFEWNFQLLRDCIAGGVEHHQHRYVADHPELRSNSASGLCGDVQQRIEFQWNFARFGPMDLVQCELHSDGHTSHWCGDYLPKFPDSERRHWDAYH